MTTCYGQRTENKPIKPATVKQNHTWSGMKTEEHDGWNALECLRGRLLAERHASKVAKEQAESLCNKFNELEKKLKEEIKLRDKAERKLKLLKKKLECFNVSTSSWQKCHSGEKCELFCGSSLCSAVSLENGVRNHNAAQEHAIVHTHNSPFTPKDGDISLLADTSSCISDLGNFLPQIPGFHFQAQNHCGKVIILRVAMIIMAQIQTLLKLHLKLLVRIQILDYNSRYYIRKCGDIILDEVVFVLQFNLLVLTNYQFST
ncbi:uncharacterized protein LOC114181161 [Vigna unguiculata]|uniref:uncharacterized protein LOC114181161 n=1 Tax=Vigna unguiculata TaxID=3917 RepID=UPI0010167B25|nr:uncharacterized protein LOC114181161 [Vigna unguiculata]